MRGLRPVAVLSLSVVAFAAAIAVERKEKEEEALERRVDQIFAAYDKPDSPGCALGVIRDGNFVYKKGYGAASLRFLHGQRLEAIHGGQRGSRRRAGVPLAR